MFKFLVLTLGIISCQAYAEDTVIVNDHDISAIKDCWQKNSDDDTDINVIKYACDKNTISSMRIK
ncbi:protein [Escherichia coli]|uniref:Protein n=1 Tax=Escherichia coli TaxID=562 RepID=A0A377A6C8_ECOLX|nr:protein [Escherichia coli]